MYMFCSIIMVGVFFFIYMDCVQDADLRSAVCVEQAAHAFLRIQPSMARKYALHLILAGHRYAKVAQVSESV